MFSFFYALDFFFLLYFSIENGRWWPKRLQIKNEIKNPSPHYNCLQVNITENCEK